MKKLEIISNCMIPGDAPGRMKTAFEGSVLELEDNVADNLLAARRARLADKDAKPVDTTKKHEAEADRRSAMVSTPETMIAATVVAAVKAALESQPKAAA